MDGLLLISGITNATIWFRFLVHEASIFGKNQKIGYLQSMDE